MSFGAFGDGGADTGFSVPGLWTPAKGSPKPLFGWQSTKTLSSVASLPDSFGGSITLSAVVAGSVDSSDPLNGYPALLLTRASATEYRSLTGGPTGNGAHAMLGVVKFLATDGNFDPLLSFGPSGGTTSALGQQAGYYWAGGTGKVDPRSFTTPATQHPAPAWAGSTTYSAGQEVANGGNRYLCTASGDSASSGGPTGTGARVVDGTAEWQYQSAAGESWHVVSKLYVPGTGTYFSLDGRAIKMSVAMPASGTWAISSAAFGIGTPWAGGQACADARLLAALYYSTLSLGLRAQIEAYLALRFGLQLPTVVTLEGDSNVRGYTGVGVIAANPYPSQLPGLTGKTLTIQDLATYGHAELAITTETWANTLWSSLAGVTSPLGGSKNIYVLDASTNDIAGGASAATVNGYDQTIITARKAAGYKVFIATTIGRHDYQSTIDQVNATRRANWQSWGADGIIDFAADPRLDNSLDLTYFSADGVHLNQTGIDVKATICAAALSSSL